MNAAAPAIIEHAASKVQIINADAGSLMAVISRAASDPTVDVDKLERLLGMYERIKANEAKAAFASALAAAKGEMPQVRRDAKNTQTSSKYATLEALADAVDPIIARHGFVPSFGTDISPVPNRERVTCSLLHSAGHSQAYFADIPSDLTGMKGTPNKTLTHAFASTLTYGRRILKLMIFDIATNDRDDDGNAAGATLGAITEEQLTSLRAAIVQVGIDIAKVLAYAKVERLEEIPQRHFAKVLQAVEQWKPPAGETRLRSEAAKS